MDWKYLRGSIMLKRQIAGLLFAGLALMLGGCGTTAKNITTVAELSQVNESRSIVFGRFEVFNNEEQAVLDPSLIYYPYPQNSDVNPSYGVSTESESGEFVWALSAGDYVFYHFDSGPYNVHFGWTSHYELDLGVKFRIPENNRTYYIGTVRAQFAAGRDFRGIQAGCAQVSLRDDFESELVAFTEKFGVPTKDIKKSLMVYSPHPTKVDWIACFKEVREVMDVPDFYFDEE